ncbi:MAG: hypothetical protein ACTSPV_19220 [Candidatus Hodarchaeales archaeon]
MDTTELVQVSLDLVGMKTLPKDSAIYVPGSNISSILYGIDIGVAELNYAKEQGYDCVMAHHPIGLVNQWEEFYRHIDQMTGKGIPEAEAKQVVQDKILQFKFGAHARNYDAITSFARLIKMPFLNIHCPSDELGRRLVTESISKFVGEGEVSLDQVRSHLEQSFTEFRKAKTKIEIVKGTPEDILGDWIFSHGAYTNGGYSIASLYYKYKIQTVIYIHISPPDLMRVMKSEQGQMIITGHLASDSIGINPYLDKLEEKGLEITAIGGLIR